MHSPEVPCVRRVLWIAVRAAVILAIGLTAVAAELPFPPVLPGGKTVVTDRAPDFLEPTETLLSGVAIAQTPPRVDFLFFPGQDYPGKPWSAWGDSLAVGGKYYASIGDHLAPAGNALVFEFDPQRNQFRKLLDLRKVLHLPDGHYVPGKIHGRLDIGSDGRLYCATHRGSTTVTADKYHYQGDWIVRVELASGKAEVVAHGPVPKHCIPASAVDPDRMIFYGGTAPGTDAADKQVQFFAYDLKARKLLYAGPNGPSRYLILARSTGRVYFVSGEECNGPLLRFDPAHPGPPVPVAPRFGLRAATQETPQGFVYATSRTGQQDATLWALNTRTEQVEQLGMANAGLQGYITSLDVDPQGRYVYYTPGAHGGSQLDGTPIVQFDVQKRDRKVIAFLHPFYKDRYGCTLQGTFSAALDPAGDKYYVTWNVSRAGKVWDCCALSVVHIPASERSM